MCSLAIKLFIEIWATQQRCPAGENDSLPVPALCQEFLGKRRGFVRPCLIRGGVLKAHWPCLVQVTTDAEGSRVHQPYHVHCVVPHSFLPILWFLRVFSASLLQYYLNPGEGDLGVSFRLL